MSIQIICIYCICHDLLSHLRIKDDCQSIMNTAEIMTIALSAAMFFEGNFAKTRQFFLDHKYFRRLLSYSRISRRIHSIDHSIWEAALSILSRILDNQESPEYLIDSFPAPVCQPCRSRVSKLYRGKEFLGHCQSKKLKYYGLKIHILVSINGIPIEFLFTPASFHDGRTLRRFNLDLKKGSTIYADKAYTSYEFENELINNDNILLLPQRQINMKKQYNYCLKNLINYKRKRIETVFSQIIKLFPRSISARTSKGFELRVFLFILAYTFQIASKHLSLANAA